MRERKREIGREREAVGASSPGAIGQSKHFKGCHGSLDQSRSMATVKIYFECEKL